MDLFRLVSRIAKGFSVVKRPSRANVRFGNDLSQTDRSGGRRPAVLSLRPSEVRCRLRGFFRPPGTNEETHGPALSLLRKDADVGASRQPCPQPDEPEVAHQPQERAHGGRRRDAPRVRLHALHPLGEGCEAGAAQEAGRVAVWAALGVWRAFLRSDDAQRLKPRRDLSSEKCRPDPIEARRPDSRWRRFPYATVSPRDLRADPPALVT